jgi:hypothetical protein
LITKEQYQEIKEYIINRLHNENQFYLIRDEFLRLFGLKRPFYSELCDLIRKDGMPFHTDSRWKDAYGDPGEPILFELQK